MSQGGVPEHYCIPSSQSIDPTVVSLLPCMYVYKTVQYKSTHTFRFDFLHARQAVETLFFQPGPKFLLDTAAVWAFASENDGPGMMVLKGVLPPPASIFSGYCSLAVVVESIALLLFGKRQVESVNPCVVRQSYSKIANKHTAESWLDMTLQRAMLAVASPCPWMWMWMRMCKLVVEVVPRKLRDDVGLISPPSRAASVEVFSTVLLRTLR